MSKLYCSFCGKDVTTKTGTEIIQHMMGCHFTEMIVCGEER